MNLTLKNLIKLVLEDKTVLIKYLIVCSLFYPLYYSIFKTQNERIYKVNIMSNYTLPNTISSLLSETFTNVIFYKSSRGEFEKNGFYCNIKTNENYKSKTLECVDKNKNINFENFVNLIYSQYEQHIDNFSISIKLSPLTFIDNSRSPGIYDFKNEYVSFLKTEKEQKFFLDITHEEKINKFSNTNYITSFILIFFLNIFRILIKY